MKQFVANFQSFKTGLLANSHVKSRDFVTSLDDH